MSNYNIQVDQGTIKKERKKARALRHSQWWKNILQKGICHYCKQEFPPEKLNMDHVVPLARGGKSNKGNLVPACLKCNTEKRLTTPVELILEKLKANDSNQQ